MTTLTGETIYLRALEPNDLEFVYAMENDQSIWEVSNTQTPYSRFLVKQYLENAHQDIYEAKQLRLAICQDEDFPAIGLIDLFDFDPQNRRAGIGIVIQSIENRKQNIGSEALELLIQYAFYNLKNKNVFFHFYLYMVFLDPSQLSVINLNFLQITRTLIRKNFDNPDPYIV